METTIRILVFGKVTGVSFRSEAKKFADSLGICGTISNLQKNIVEIFAQGNQNQISEFLCWCSKGSKNAKVKSLEYHYLDGYSKMDSFEIVE